MTDIVERLRDWHDKVHCCGVIDLSMALEAADEIEWLREALVWSFNQLDPFEYERGASIHGGYARVKALFEADAVDGGMKLRAVLQEKGK